MAASTVGIPFHLHIATHRSPHYWTVNVVHLEIIRNLLIQIYLWEIEVKKIFNEYSNLTIQAANNHLISSNIN